MMAWYSWARSSFNPWMSFSFSMVHLALLYSLPIPPKDLGFLAGRA